MKFLKAFSIITLWILLSFFWVSMGQSKEKGCMNYGDVETWLKPHPVLSDWYHFYSGQHVCNTSGDDFFKTLASSESLSTKLNQARVTFDQFYVPVSHLMNINWDQVKVGNMQSIESDLTQIDHSLGKTLKTMNPADQDYFRATVLLDLPSEFAKANVPQEEKNESIVTRRLNQKSSGDGTGRIFFKEVVSPPYQQTYKFDPKNNTYPKNDISYPNVNRLVLA